MNTEILETVELTKVKRGRPKNISVIEIKPEVIVEPIVEPIVKTKKQRKVKTIDEPLKEDIKEEVVINEEIKKALGEPIKKKPINKVVRKKNVVKEAEGIAEVVNVLESEAMKNKINTVKKVYKEDDIKFRMDLVKSTIKDKQIIKTKRENEYLKKKLAELEIELNELYSDETESEEEIIPIKKKVRNVKAIKVPKKQLNDDGLKYMTRTDLMKSFGF